MLILPFITALLPAATELIKALHGATGGDAAKARVILRTMADHWRGWDGTKGDLRARLDAVLAQRADYLELKSRAAAHGTGPIPGEPTPLERPSKIPRPNP